MTDYDFNLRGINRFEGGFWINVTSARNMFYAALDSVHSDFQEARENYLRRYLKMKRSVITTLEDIQKLNQATNKLVSLIRYRIIDKVGGSDTFVRNPLLKGLVSMKRDFLDKKESFGALLRCFLPGVIDEDNEHAIQPHEVEQGWWNNQAYVEKQVFRALCRLPGFREPFNDFVKLKDKSKTQELNDEEKTHRTTRISQMGDIINETIFTRRHGSGQHPFIMHSGLQGLVGVKRGFLDKQYSLLALIRCFLPEVAQYLEELRESKNGTPT